MKVLVGLFYILALIFAAPALLFYFVLVAPLQKIAVFFDHIAEKLEK
jgi:hypothetical protein